MPASHRLQRLSLDRGIETLTSYVQSYTIGWLQRLSLDRGIETIQTLFLADQAKDCCKGCPSIEGLKLYNEAIVQRQVTSCKGCPSIEGLKHA